VFVGVLIALRVTTTRDCRNLGSVSELSAESVSFVPCANVYIVHGAGEFVAVFLAESPDEIGTHIGYDSSRHEFVDSLGQRFDVRGFRVGGLPQQKPLLICPTIIQDDRIRILAPSPSLASIQAACRGPRYTR
jgi:hypothetical protein